jgi:LysM repeat protein
VDTATPMPTATRTPPVFPTASDGARGTIDADCNYTVVVGDRLFRIALRFGKTVKQLTDANNLTSASLIHPEQVLKIPDCLE